MHTLSKLSLISLLLTTGNGLITNSALADDIYGFEQQQTFQNFLELPGLTILDVSGPSQSSESDEIIFADGSDYDIDLSGRDGRDASHPEVRGRSGEAGEDGGTLTVYYNYLTDLRNIYVDASGGEGGIGAPGSSSYQCLPSFPEPFWEDDDSSHHDNWNPINPPEPQLIAPPSELLEQLPQEGRERLEELLEEMNKSSPVSPLGSIKEHGSDSTNCTTATTPPGPTGNDGRPGQLRIVNREELLPPETPEISATVAKLIEQPVDLSRHLWRERQGAAELLAPGSIIADEYQEYVEQLAVTAQLQWEASQPLSDFETAQATLYLKEDGRVLVDLGEEMWTLSETRQRDNLSEVAITALVPEAEVLDLAEGGFQRSGDTLNLVVIDLAGHSESLDTTFHVHYHSTDRRQLDTPRADWQTHYQGDVPAAAVTRDHNRFSLDLSQLPIEP